MGYIDKNLISGESIAYRANRHWVVLAKPVVVSLILIVFAGLLFYIASKGAAPREAWLMNWLGSGLLVAAAIPIVVGELNRRTAEFAVTNKRVVLKVGALQNRTEEMFLNKIESVNVDQTFTGRVLGYGTIVIRGTGGSLEPFELVSAPLHFRHEIQEQIGKASEPASKSSTTK